MTFCLTTTITKSEKDLKVENAVILLHGYGGDGKDINILTLSWKRFLPNTIFLCPNGHDACPINPSGFQWFDLSKDDPDHILEGTYKAEKKIQQFIFCGFIILCVRLTLESLNLDRSRISTTGYRFYWFLASCVSFVYVCTCE